VDGQDPRQELARYLRALREERWPGRKVTQPELAQALGGDKPLSVPLISSWESKTAPRIPPPSRLDGYAAVFATERSFSNGQPRMLTPRELSDEERHAMAELKQQLGHLRSNALGATSSPTTAAQAGEVEESLSAGPWRFDDGNDITIVCAKWPEHMLRRMPYTDVNDPDYIELLTYSELDALFELHGHIRAANPANQVNLRVAGQLAADDYSSHLISLGGVDWNTATSTALQRLPLPVRQIADWDAPAGQYFEVDDNGTIARFSPVIERGDTRSDHNVTESSDLAGDLESPSGAADKGMLREDVALFARAVSPFNRRRTVTICNGMYGRGTYGVVRALTDARFRDRNADYLQRHFGDSNAYCILTRVPIADGVTLTPDWTTGDYTLFEWGG
jgi:transcriptional regulator with XRE-family HTH domain